MDDRQLIELYFARSETAIYETDKAYGRYLRHIGFNILNDHQDTEECVNDTYFSAWRLIPPRVPAGLAMFLGKIIRNLALDKYRIRTSQKRGGGIPDTPLSELEGCLSAPDGWDDAVDGILLRDLLNSFLGGLRRDDRVIFVQRYWYFCTVSDIAEELGVSQSKVKMSLLRSRDKLRRLLEREGVGL